MFQSFRKYLILFLLTFLGYFAEVCIMPYVKIFGVTPNLLYVVIGIVTVAYGKLRAFWVGLVYGILMQIMLPSVTMLNLALYPLTTLFCSFAFADKPLKTLEYERAVNHRRKELPPWLRTVLCTMLNTFVYETVQITYIYLGGSPLTVNHFLRGLADVFFTGVLCFLLQYPVRRLIFGRRGRPQPVMRPAPVVFTKS
ncbi:MAG: hypothetical protein IIY60_00565 [Clostridia bacterium]|nr:hypothetical protein [Clostridia bacterium]